MRLFLLVYDRMRGRLVDIYEYEPEERAQALADRFEREVLERFRPEMEVVLLAAESLEALQQTHGRYFYGGAVRPPVAEAL